MAAEGTDLPKPRHVAIIMDGNGRWALGQGRPRSHGHQAGGEALKRVIEACLKRRIPYLTVYAFSSENWRRPAMEVRRLMELFLSALNREVRRLHEAGVKLRFSGDLSAFNAALRNGMLRAEHRTRNNTRLTLNVAVNYGGRAEIVAATRRIAAEVAAGRLQPDDIDEQTVARNLILGSLPEPDLFIRTGGEQRLSNFLLWQLAYTELYFCDVLWPDFGESHLDEALAAFAGRERRFGGVTARRA